MILTKSTLGNSYCARPGPRLVRETGLIAQCWYPLVDLPEHSALPDGVKQITIDMYNVSLYDLLHCCIPIPQETKPYQTLVRRL